MAGKASPTPLHGHIPAPCRKALPFVLLEHAKGATHPATLLQYPWQQPLMEIHICLV